MLNSRMEVKENINIYNMNRAPTSQSLQHATVSDEPSESVDLLQMVTDMPLPRTPKLIERNTCPRHAPRPPYKSHSLDSESGQRMRYVVLPEDKHQDILTTELEDATSGHICHSCNESARCMAHCNVSNTGASDIYAYHTSTQHQHPLGSRTVPSQTNRSLSGNEEGSVYFNYLKFANTSTGNTPCTVSSVYEPVDRKPASNKSSLSSVFSCCIRRKSARAKQRKVKKRQPHKTPEHEDAFLPKTENESASNVLMRGNNGSKDWRRIKRLLLLAAILLGILLAIGGMVVGFLLMGPRQEPCHSGFVYCSDVGCVSIAEACSIGSTKCQLSDKNKQCNVSVAVPPSEREDEMLPPGKPLHSHTDHPLKDIAGWVHYNGSRYIVINSPMTFYAGQEECRQKGGYLVHINTLREQVFIEDFLRHELLNIDIASETAGFWIGARRARGSQSGTCMLDQWKWLDAHGRTHAVISGFTAFIPGKPDNYLKWDDTPCDIQSNGAIKVLCEVPSK